MDDLVKALGLDGISKSQVSVLCQELDTEVERFRSRKLEGTSPYGWVDATLVKTRQDHRLVSMAVVIAVGPNAATGQREVLGVDVGPREDGAFWLRLLRSRVSRGLSGVQLVTSDAHQGLKGAAWLTSCGHASRASLSSGTRPSRRGWPMSPSPRRTGARSGPTSRKSV